MFSQNLERIELKGIIVASNTDVEGVTIYNASSNKGVITNQKGEFVIAVTQHDVLEISALQFETISVTITSQILKDKFLKLYLSEQLNQLDTVLLSSGLSGVLAYDVSKIKELPKISINFGNLNTVEYFDEKAFDNQVISDNLNAVVNKGMLYNGVNLGAIVGLFMKPKRKKATIQDVENEEKPTELIAIYNSTHLSKTYHIPLEDVGAFLVFVENNGLKPDLLKKENEFMLIEFLVKQSDLFLKTKHANH